MTNEKEIDEFNDMQKVLGSNEWLVFIRFVRKRCESYKNKAIQHIRAGDYNKAKIAVELMDDKLQDVHKFIKYQNDLGKKIEGRQ